MFGLIDSALNFCPISKIEPCWSNRVNIMWGFCCWVWAASHINNMLTLRKEIKMSVWSFVVHKIKAIEFRCLLGSWRRRIFESKLSCIVKVSKSYFSPWMSSNGDVHTTKSIPLVFFGDTNSKSKFPHCFFFGLKVKDHFLRFCFSLLNQD
jgi:hypothetical protein